MSLFEYLLQCGFWQWIGNITLASILTIGLAEIIKAIRGK